jgi:hypothetical protein
VPHVRAVALTPWVLEGKGYLWKGLLVLVLVLVGAILQGSVQHPQTSKL